MGTPASQSQPRSHSDKYSSQQDFERQQILNNKVSDVGSCSSVPGPVAVQAYGCRDRPIYYFMFFLSGIAGLVYEISWSRQIGLLFGHTVHAAAIVLGSFFFGLSLGYLVGGRYARRLNPLTAYGVVELIAASWALVVPLLIHFMDVNFWSLASTSPMLRFAIRGAACVLVLLPATVSLGTTLPLMAELLGGNSQSLAGRVSRAYAWNTAGGFVGVVCTTSFLIVEVGVLGSSYLAAGLSATAGLIALCVAFYTKPRGWLWQTATAPERPDPATVHEEPRHELGRGLNTTDAVLAAVCGFGTLALEVLYTRLFSLIFHNSTYTFGAVIAVFLAALAAGAATVPKLMSRSRPTVLIGGLSLIGSFTVAGSPIVFVSMTGLEYFTSGESFWSYLFGGTLLISLVIFPPIAVVGTLLPLLWQAGGETRADSRRVGLLTTVNTIAAASGAIAASFLMLPRFGLWGSFATISALFGLAAVLSFSRLGKRKLALLAVGLAATNAGLLILVCGHWIHQASAANEVVVRRWESAYGWIDLVRDNRTGEKRIRQNLHYGLGSTGAVANRERRQAHIPLLLHERPRNALFLGQGTGMTPAGALSHKEVERITIVELIPEVVEASRALAEFNDSVLDNTRVKVEIDDARHYLLGTDQQFDVIVSDLFVPWESHTGYLYTVEHYRTARKRLARGGLFCQWLPLYQVGARDFRMIADSFASVFPNTTIWWGQLNSEKAIVALIGSEGPQTLDRARVTQRLQQFHDPIIRSPETLHGLFAGSWYRNPGLPLNTDEHPRVEFASPISQGDKRLLSGPVLESFYDTELKTLPEGNLQSDFRSSSEDVSRRRAWQHFMVFGS